MNKTYYTGIDVHQEKCAIASALAGSLEDATYDGTSGGSVPSTEGVPRSPPRKLRVEFKVLKVCYDAGQSGFVLAWRLH